MLTEEGNSLKSLIRTTFVPVHIKTGRKDKHTNAFMEFAKSVELDEDFTNISLYDRAALLSEEFRNKS